MKKRIVIISVIVLIVLICLISIILINRKPQEETNNSTTISDNVENIVPDKLNDEEKDVSKKKKEELFEFIPKIYTEEIAPFTSQFMLNAVMDKILETDENQDFSTKNVDKMVKTIFGNEASINKNEVSEPDIAKSLFYYSKEANSYAVIPIGYEGVFKYQILKNVTETNDYYYIYVYSLIGGYSYDENSITKDEFGDINYDNAKVQVIVGDKDGKDLVHVFDNYSKIYDESIWLNNYGSIMPIFRYTLKKEGRNYYLTEVEQINY